MYEISEVPFETSVPGGVVRGVRTGPVDEGRYPTIVFAHGIDSTYRTGTAYADRLCPHGYVMYCFDFRGGSRQGLSGGETTDMSVMTDLEEFARVVEMARPDADGLYAFGTSQGGLVSALYAARHPQDVEGLILLYPGLNIPDNVRELFEG